MELAEPSPCIPELEKTPKFAIDINIIEFFRRMDSSMESEAFSMSLETEDLCTAFPNMGKYLGWQKWHPHTKNTILTFSLCHVQKTSLLQIWRDMVEKNSVLKITDERVILSATIVYSS